MTAWALRWSVSGAFVTDGGVPALFATEAQAREHFRKHYSYLESGKYESAGGIPRPVLVEVRAV